MNMYQEILSDFTGAMMKYNKLKKERARLYKDYLITRQSARQEFNKLLEKYAELLKYHTYSEMMRLFKKELYLIRYLQQVFLKKYEIK